MAEVRTLDLHVDTSDRLFNSIDPAPFRDRDLDPAVVTYVVEWAEDLPGDALLKVCVQLDTAAADGGDAEVIKAGFAENFRQLSATKRRELRRLFRDGRISLLIGLGFVAAAILISESISTIVDQARYAQIVADSAVIGAWVALWHPINIFLFDWWPIRRRAQLYDRIAGAEVMVSCASKGSVPAPAG
jgi:hypothetical protein